ncbi:unnamed protein product, partial [Phaeothamnion confervicola]
GGGGGGSSGSGDDPGEPTMRDLRAKIARDLDMAEATDLLELLVCDHIVGLDLPVRVVQQTLWRRHVLENVPAGPDGDEYGSDCEAAALPAMVVTYRLAGVDGEATEDTVDVLDDAAAAAVGAQSPEERFAVTTAIAEEGGLPVLLELAQPPEQAAGAAAASSGGFGGGFGGGSGESWEVFALALGLLRHCCALPANRAALLAIKAPGVLLHRLLEV